MRQLTPEQQALLDSTPLLSGSHKPGTGYCLMELVAYLAGERHTDRPACACPVLATFVRTANDEVCHADRQKLKTLAPLLLDSKATLEIERKRALMFADYAVRKWAPRALRDVQRDIEAAKLEALAPITDPETAIAAYTAAVASPATRVAASAAVRNSAHHAAHYATYYACVPIAEQIEAVRQAAMIREKESEYPPAMNSKDTQEKA